MGHLHQTRPRARKPSHLAMLGCFGLPVLLAVLLAIGASVWLVLDSVRRSEAIEAMQAERRDIIKDLKKGGYPVTEEAWEARYPPVPDDENGALLYERAFAAGRALPPEQDFLVPYVGKLEPASADEPYSSESLAAMRAHLEANQEALELAAKAAAMPRAKFQSYGLVDSGVSSLEKVRAVADLHQLRIEIAAIDGDLAGVESTMRSLHACATALEESTAHFDGFISLRLRSRYFKSLEAILKHTTPSERLLAELASLDWGVSAEEVYANAIVHGMLRIEHPDLAGMMLLLEDWRLFLPLVDDYKEKIVARIVEEYWLHDLRLRQAVLELLDRPAREAGPAFERLEQDFEANVAEGLTLFGARISLQPLWEARAYARLHSTALMLERYRLDTGTPPDALARLVPKYMPAVPLDPYDGQPIRYMGDDTGYMLYCVGENLADDGGVQYRKRSEQQEKGDVVFVVHPNPQELQEGGDAQE